MHAFINAAELQKIKSLVELSDVDTPERSGVIFRRFRNPYLSDAIQMHLWIDLFVEGVELRRGKMNPDKLNPKKQVTAAKIAKIAYMDFEPLATIEYKIGKRGLLLLLKSIPMWNNREECLEILREDIE